MDFYKDSFERIKKLKPRIKDSTINQYLLNIKKISKELFKSYKPSIYYFKDFCSIKEYIENFKSLASKKNIITSILVTIKSYTELIPQEIIEMYTDYHKELSKKQEDSYLDNAKTTREEKNWISSRDIKDKISSIETEINNAKYKDRKILDKKQQHLVLNLYTLLPPLRNDYVLVKIIEKPENEENDSCLDKSFNFINLTTKHLLLCNYKTDKFYGIKKIELPENLFDIIKTWEISKKKYYKDGLKHNFLLLNTTTGTPMKHNTLTKYINKIFYPKKISTTLLRKIYLSEKYPVTVTYREQAKDSYIMGHSIGTQKMIYSKIDN